nr:hypothetical protein [Tanacetum cinerariifolium]
MVAICEYNTDFHPMVDFIAASPLRYALIVKPTIFVSHIRQFWSTARIETTEKGTHILATVDGIKRTISESSLRRNLKLRDEDGIVSLPDTKLFENLTLMGPSFSRRIVPLFDTMLVHQGEGSGIPTETHHTPSLEADPSYHTTSSMPLPSILTAPFSPVTQTETTLIWQYTRRARISQSSALPTVADEPASLAPEVEIRKLKDKVKVLEDREGVAAIQSGDDAPIKGRSIDEGEAATKRISDDSEELARVLTSMDAATVLAGGIDIPTGSDFIPTAGPPVGDIPTGSDDIPTASLVFATATVVTPYSRRKGKEVMVESDTPKKQRLQEQIDAQVARDAEVAKIHAEEELQGMIDSLDRTNETIAKYIQEYQEFASELPLERRIELISWKVKDFKGMAFEEIKAKFNMVWKQVEDFIPIGSKEEAERHKRKGIRFDQESSKKLKSSEEVIKDVKSTEEIPEEKIKEMMQLVPIEEVYVQALQVKHPIIDWKVYTKGQRSYWKIIRSHTSTIRSLVLRVIHKMITYGLCQRTTRYEKIQKNDLWLLSMFDARHQNGYVNVAWLIMRWIKRKGPGCNRDAKPRYNTRLAQLLPRHIYSPCVVNWDVLNRMGCDGEIDDMLRIMLRKARSDEKIFTLVAWIRAFNINEPIYVELCHEFYSTYEFDEVCVDDELQTNKIIKFRLGGCAHSLTLLEFARRLGLYQAVELEEEGFNVYFKGGLRSDERFNTQDYWLSISRKENLSLSKSHTFTIKNLILRVIYKMITYSLGKRTTRVIHKMITYSLCQRKTWYDKIKKNDLWLLSMFDARHKNGYAKVAWVIARWTKRKGDGTQKEIQICYGQFISKISRKCRVLTEDVLIPEDPQPGIPRVGSPRPPIVSMKDLCDRIGRMEIRQEAIERMEYRKKREGRGMKWREAKI